LRVGLSSPPSLRSWLGAPSLRRRSWAAACAVGQREPCGGTTRRPRSHARGSRLSRCEVNIRKLCFVLRNRPAQPTLVLAFDGYGAGIPVHDLMVRHARQILMFQGLGLLLLGRIVESAQNTTRASRCRPFCCCRGVSPVPVCLDAVGAVLARQISRSRP
jgi:hypothetical protein